MSKQTSRVCNWSDYNRSLVRRGSITLWLDQAVWEQVPPDHKRGRPFQYSHPLIEAALTLKSLYHLNFRALQGFLESVIGLMQADYPVPHYSTLSRRQSALTVRLSPVRLTEPMHLVVDSTGLKIYGEGEWCVKKHGKSYQRTWRKVHLAIDAGSLAIHACHLTSSRTQDSSVLPLLLDQVDQTIGRLIADGAYDTFACYELALQREAIAIIPPRRDGRLSSETIYHQKAASPPAIAQRDQTIEQISVLGRDQWKKRQAYHQRSLVETTMYRLKALLGQQIKAKVPQHQLLEVRLRCQALNKMIALGRPLRLVY